MWPFNKGTDSYTDFFGTDHYSDGSSSRESFFYDGDDYYDNSGSYSGSSSYNSFTGETDYYDADGSYHGSSYYDAFTGDEVFDDGTRCWTDCFGERHYD